MQQTATSAPSAKPAARTYPSIKTALPGPLAKAIVDRDRAFTSHAYLKEYPLVIARGEGVMVEDVDGNRFLDFMSGIAVSSTGYGHPKVIAAVQEAAANFLHICGSDFYFEGMAALSERLARLTPGNTPKRPSSSLAMPRAVRRSSRSRVRSMDARPVHWRLPRARRGNTPASGPCFPTCTTFHIRIAIAPLPARPTRTW
jgi:hypothetical protein